MSGFLNNRILWWGGGHNKEVRYQYSCRNSISSLNSAFKFKVAERAILFLEWNCSGGGLTSSAVALILFMLSISIIIENIDNQVKIRIMISMVATSEDSLTISELMDRYLRSVERSRSKSTMLAYKNGLRIFRATLEGKSLDPDKTPIQKLTENLFAKFIEQLGTYAPTTEQLYLQAVKGFYLFVDAEELVHVNQARLKVLMKQRSRRVGLSIPLSPLEEIETLLEKMWDVENLITSEDDGQKAHRIKLRAYRDRAFLLMLADTGFRVHEACSLRRGDMNWKEGYAIIVGKGNKQAVVRFTARSTQAIKEYLSQRAALDGTSGKQLSALPLFARHDKGAGKKIKPMTPTTGRNIVEQRVEQFLGKGFVGTITPHTFRHYFVTSVLRGTGNLRYAQELARHENIETTKRYTHLTNEELDKAYYDVFEKNSKWRTK